MCMHACMCVCMHACMCVCEQWGRGWGWGRRWITWFCNGIQRILTQMSTSTHWAGYLSVCSELKGVRQQGGVSAKVQDTHLPSHFSFCKGSWILLADSHFVMLFLHAHLQKHREGVSGCLTKRFRGMLTRLKNKNG